MPVFITRERDYNTSTNLNKGTDHIIDDVLTISKANLERLNYPHFAPTWDRKQEQKFTNPKPFKAVDRGFFADPKFESIMKNPGVTINNISPKLGTEITGLQLNQLSDQQKDDLALLTSQRGVVIFRNQDLKDQSFDDILELGRYYGPLHVHPTSGAPSGEVNFHIVFRRGEKGEQERIFEDSLSGMTFHSDVSYETQPPGLTFLAMLQTGEGGDTQFIDTIEAYERLSPLMKDKLEGLKVLNTSKDQAYMSKSGGSIERKKCIESIHPLVRYHPTLGKKSLFINRGFSRRILGLKQDESDNLLIFLINHIQTCLDAHIRAKWDDRTVVFWDNRRLLHSATFDWDSEDIRHGLRVTPLAERPVGSKKELDEWTPEKEERNIEKTEYYLGLSPSKYYQEVYKNN